METRQVVKRLMCSKKGKKNHTHPNHLYVEANFVMKDVERNISPL